MSSEERWAQISDILARALDLPEPQREAYIAGACERQPALRTEMLAMFQDLGTTNDFLETPPAVDAAPGDGAEFGAYRIVRTLGEGGMGVVYLAERCDGQFARHVAVKRIGSFAPGPDLLRRFRDEREILARLDHPNIARLLDAGFDSLAVPYLVMEYVEGAPMTAWCRDHRLSVRERLGLFLKICGAVQHAHRNLVIHRDLKPGNILVTPDGEPKLLDFGIAKILSEGRGEATRTINRALSLDYASPEQVRGDTLTTATDVYSLGVLLYELLTDVRPYNAEGKSLTDAVRAVCEEIPPPLSRVAPAARRPLLAGDLDTIAAKAMEKAPADRYASVADLAGDIRAHLDHRPVKERRLSVTYVARKFVRRHRAGTTIAAGVVALLAIGVGGVIWQARIAQRERARAEQRFQDVRELATFVIFDLQDRIAKLAGATEIRKQMVERSLRYLDSLASEAGDDPTLLQELGGGYIRLADALGRSESASLGDTAGALAAYGKARALLERVLANHGPDAGRRRQLARLLLTISTLERNTGQLEPAARNLHASLATWNELVRDDPESEENLRGLASAHFGVSTHHFRSGRPAEAASEMERALELFERLLNRKPDDTDRKRNVALSHKNLVGYYVQRDTARSLRHAERAAQLDSERVAAEPHNSQAKLDYAIDLSTLGDHYVLQEQYERALAYYEQSIPLRKTLAEADPMNVFAAQRLAYMLQQTGETYVLAGQHARGLPPLLDSLKRIDAIPANSRDDEIGWIQFRAYVALGEAHFMMKQNHCAWDRRAAASPRPAPQLLGSDERRLADRSLARVRSCGT
jgi:serine/threonine protein kinase/tetratricopeptide (TPR) repeat protein